MSGRDGAGAAGEVWSADIGGTAAKLGILRGGRILARGRVEVAEGGALGTLLRQMTAAWVALRRELPAAEGPGPDRVALAFAGIVDARVGRVRSTNGKFLDAPALDLPRWAAESCDAPLALENDARAACVGEWKAGAGRGCDDLAMMTLGTGIGTSAVMEGRLVRGGRGQAGILGGHVTVHTGGPACTCGNVGCAEAMASTSQLRFWIQRLASEARFAASPLAGSASASYAEVADAAADGDALAEELHRRAVAAWGACAVGLVHAYDPTRLVIGGGVGRGWESVREGIADHVHRHAWTPWGRVGVAVGELGDDAALIGAAWLPAVSNPSPAEPEP